MTKKNLPKYIGLMEYASLAEHIKLMEYAERAFVLTETMLANAYLKGYDGQFKSDLYGNCLGLKANVDLWIHADSRISDYLMLSYRNAVKRFQAFPYPFMQPNEELICDA